MDIYLLYMIYIYTKYYYTNTTPMINEQLDWYWYLRSHCGHGLWVVGEHQWLAPQNLCKYSPNQLNIWLFSRGIYVLPWISGHAYLCKPNTYTLYIFFFHTAFWSVARCGRAFEFRLRPSHNTVRPICVSKIIASHRDAHFQKSRWHVLFGVHRWLWLDGREKRWRNCGAHRRWVFF